MDSSPLCSLGHVATRRDLDASGVGRRELDSLLRAGSVIRPRKGVYACRHLSTPECIAVIVGARLDCVTVLRRHAIWVGHEKGVHLRMPTHAGPHAGERLKRVVNALASARRWVIDSGAICVHWSTGAAPEIGNRLEVPVMDALRAAMTCLPPDDLIAALESALHLRKITTSELDQLIIEAPERLQQALASVTPGAQSGYETKARLKLQRRGHTVEIQVLVAGVGKVDLVVDGVVVLEIDGRETHAEAFEIDRDRDVGTELQGLRVLRIPAVWVDTRWDYVLAALERMVEDARRSRDRHVQRLSRRRARIRAEILGDTPSPG